MRTKFAALAAVLMLAVAGTVAFAADATTVKGTVKSAADDKSSFVVTSKDGKDTTVKVNDQTKYTLDKADADFAKATATGNRVSADVNGDGVATTVTAKGAAKPKKGAAEAAPAAPAATPAK